MPWTRRTYQLFLGISVFISAVLALLLFSRGQPLGLLRIATKQTEQQSTIDIDRAYYPPNTPEICSAYGQDADFCASFPNFLLADIQIVVKTGIGEREKLESLLSTFGSCISNVLIVSDLEDEVLGHRVHDVLADLPQDLYAFNNTDWAHYGAQKAAHAKGETLGKSAGGWKLDRFKFLPMIEKAWEVAKGKKWFVFIETDTYYFWDTLFRQLEQIDPDKRHYLGGETAGAYDVWFAYGGAGFILSRKLMQDLFLPDRQERLSVKHEALVKEDCCGDATVAYTLFRELGVRVESLRPTISGDEPQWAEVNDDNVCVPLLGLHHVGPEKMSQLWKWERCGRPLTEAPITFASLLDFDLAPILESGNTMRETWDNGAGIEQDSYKSSSACFKGCLQSKTCLQATFNTDGGGMCRFSSSARSGNPVGREMMSYWNLKNIQRRLGWAPGTGEGGSCRRVEWQEPKMTGPEKSLPQALGVVEWP